MHRFVRRSSVYGLLIAVVLSIGCGGSARLAYQRAERAAERESWDQAVLEYAKAVALDPGNTRFKAALIRAKLRAATVHFDRGKKYLDSGQLELALTELQQAVVLDPSNQFAVVEMQKLLEEMERRRADPSDIEKARAAASAQAQSLGPPKLDPGTNVPLALNFPDSTVEEVYNSLSKVSGINFLYDEKLDLSRKTSVELANVTFEKAMDILMLTHKHFYKVIDGHTILIAEENRQNRQQYGDQVIRTFYLSNAETKNVQQLLRSLLETRKIQENPDLNAITIKDNPEVIKIAERIINANDKAKGEVIVDLELLEVNRSSLQDLGVDLSSKSLSIIFGGGDELVPLNNLSRIRSEGAWSVGPIPSVQLSFLKSDSDSKTIAKPQLRIIEGETGKITIGDRVPIPATTFNTSQTIGGNIVPITSFTYQNVGIIVDVKPRVHHNREITVELKIEISSLGPAIEGSGGISQPTINTRTVESVLRLRDGETNLLAGLIQERESQSLSGIPGLSEIPILRRIFGSTSEDTATTDIVMSITPHIIRLPNIQPIDMVPLWVGTEERIELRGVARNALGESPFGQGEDQWAEFNAELNGEPPSPANDPNAERINIRSPSEGGGARGDQGRSGRRNRPNARPSRSQPPSQGDELPDEGRFGEGDALDAGSAAPGADAPQADRGADPEADNPPRPTAPAEVRLAPDRVQIAAGESVGVDVVVSDAVDVSMVNFQLRYDPNVLQFVPPAQPGNLLQQGGSAHELQAVESAEGGLLVVSAARAGSAGMTGSGMLVRLNFVAVGEGEAGFQFSAAQVRDAKSSSLPARFRRAQVQVTP